MTPQESGRDCMCVVVEAKGRRTLMTIDRLVGLIVEAVREELWAAGFVAQADLDAREGRLREVARLSNGDFRVITGGGHGTNPQAV
jgi:hypothetical protein